MKGNISVDLLLQFEHCQVSDVLGEISELDGRKNVSFKNISSNIRRLRSIFD